MQKEPPQTIDKKPPSMLVDVMRVHAANEKTTVKAQGSVTPRTQTTLVSEVSGLITEVSAAFVAGGFFSKGDVLVRIDDRNYRAEVKRAQAAVRAAETNVTRETGLADYAREDWERAQSVLRSSKAATDLAMRKPQQAEALASLEFAKADLEKREGDLDRTVIRAPYDGLVREKRADIGQFVNSGSPLAVTFSVEVAEIRLPLPDSQLPYLNLDEHELVQGRGPGLYCRPISGDNSIPGKVELYERKAYSMKVVVFYISSHRLMIPTIGTQRSGSTLFAWGLLLKPLSKVSCYTT